MLSGSGSSEVMWNQTYKRENILNSQTNLDTASYWAWGIDATGGGQNGWITNDTLGTERLSIMTLPLPSWGSPVLPDWAGNLAALAEVSLTDPKVFYFKSAAKSYAALQLQKYLRKCNLCGHYRITWSIKELSYSKAIWYRKGFCWISIV